MNLVKVSSIEQYSQLVERFSRKGKITNDYLHNDVAGLILNNRLYTVCGQSNVLLFVQKEGFYRLYYYINDLKERLILPSDSLVTEIVFRDENLREEELHWLEDLGFHKNIIRDQYFARYSSLTEPNPLIGAIIEIAQTIEEVHWAIELFNASFDKWSGDFLAYDMCESLLANHQILIAKNFDGTLLGALHFDVRHGINWLHHLAVISTARGHGVGRGLLEAYIEIGHKNDANSRYMLWVKRDNFDAIHLYRNKGFVPMNKSSLSLIKF